MTAVIPVDDRDLFAKPAFGVLAALLPDGQPQATPVWCDLDGTHVLVNTARWRVLCRIQPERVSSMG